jgi:GNAT superfamily N-acetyltransferase
MYLLQAENTEQLNQALRVNMLEFNAQHFDVERQALGFKYLDKQHELVAGISGHVFGNWLLISWLWCAESARGNGLADSLLTSLENAAIEMGAVQAQLDTLDFQAKPFYEKRGYQVKYQLNNYPLSGTRYFMEKPLVAAK